MPDAIIACSVGQCTCTVWSAVADGLAPAKLV